MFSYTTIITELLDKVDSILVDFVYNGYQGLVEYLSVPLASAIVLFFVCYGLGISQGWIKGSVSGMTHSLFKIGVIYFIGMNWGHFSEYVYDLFYKGSSEIGSAILKHSTLSDYQNQASLNSGLQQVLSTIWNLAQDIFNNGGVTNPGPWIAGSLVGFVGLVFIGLALLEIIIAKCMLSILFVTAPLFIAFTLFEVTQSFFDRWLGACVGYASLMIFMCASLGIVLSLDQWILDDYVNPSSNKMTWIDTATAILVTWICIGIVKRIGVLALSIGGTVTTISAEESFASGVGVALGAGSISKKAYGFIKDKVSGGDSHINDRSRFLKDSDHDSVSRKDEGPRGGHSAGDRSRFINDRDAGEKNSHRDDRSNEKDYRQKNSHDNQDKGKYRQHRQSVVRVNTNHSNNRKKESIEEDYE